MGHGQIGWLFLVLVTMGCGGRAAEAPPRSPSLDYPPAPVETSDGRVVGADGIAPGDKLASGARVGAGGLVPAEHAVEGEPSGHASPAPRPCSEIGLEDVEGRSRCVPSAPAPPAR